MATRDKESGMISGNSYTMLNDVNAWAMVLEAEVAFGVFASQRIFLAGLGPFCLSSSSSAVPVLGGH